MFWRSLRVVFVLALLGVLFLAATNVQALQDWWLLRGYNPPPQVSALAAQDTMTQDGMHLFYINHPQLIDQSSVFKANCKTYEQTIVLGCYHAGENGIFIFAVEDSRLQGVQQVTSAHEMLHAAYERLSKSEKNYVDGLLNDYYSNDLHDQRLIDTINDYKKTEPNDVVNEMHSMFGTEVANLPAPLEKYYQQYFSNRASVVAFASNYQAEFTSRSAKIKDYEQQLANLKQKIDTEENNLSSQASQIDTDRRQLDKLNAAGSIAQYNAGVPGFNAEVDSYNAGVVQLKNDITNYNKLVVLHNQLAGELSSLYNSLNTNLTPQTVH